MHAHSIKKYFICLHFLIMLFPCLATDYGSWYSVNYQTTALNPPTGYNTLTGFYVLNAGITLTDAATFLLFNTVYPVFGALTFNGGTIALIRDMYFGASATFANAGSVAARGFQVSLPAKVASFTLPAMTLGQIKLLLNSNVTLSGTTTFTGNSYIDGNGFTIDCTSGSISIASGATLSLNNVILANMSATSLSCLDNTATCTIFNTQWSLLSSYTFNRGNLVVLGDWVISGTNVFTYASPQSLSIASQASVLFDQGMTFSYAPSSASKTLISFADATAALYFRNATVYVVSTGLQLTKGLLIFEGLCPVVSRATSSANGITLGDGSSSSNNMNMKVLAGSGPYVTSGYLVNNNV